MEGIENGNSEGFTFNEGLIKLGEGVTIEPGTTQTVAYIQFMLDRKAVEGIIGQNDNSTGLENVAEIGDFGTFDRDGNKYAAIDKNSRPGNTVFGNIDTYEDDTDIAPAMRLEYGNNRDVSGMVFLDSTRAETIVNTIREGDGVYGDGDQGIDGVEILLEETSGSGLSYHATTFDGGGYSFNGFIPGEYKMTFTWGDGNYPIKNYKGTIYLDKERQYNEYWYMDEATRYSDAMDDWGKRQNIDNGNSSDTKMISTTPKMKINVEKLVGTGEGNKKTQSEPKDQTDPTANNFIISNVDFGITERARQEIKANKNVSRIEIKLPNGQTIAKAEFDENGDFADGYKDEKDHKYITKEGIIKAELDSELIQGSTLYVDYNINVNNIGELDY